MWLVLGAHALTDVILWLGPWRFVGMPQILAIAWTMSQNSLVAAWAASRVWPSYLRVAAAASGAACTWVLCIRVMPGIAVYGPASAAWATAFVVQSGLVFVAVAAGCWHHRRIEIGGSAGRKRSGRTLQYGVGFLLIWTALIAMMLGLGRTAFSHFGWSGGLIRWQYFTNMPIIGLGSAAVAILVLLSLVTRGWLPGRIAVTAMVVIALGYGQSLVTAALCGDNGGLMPTGAMLLAGAQAAYLYATLLLVNPVKSVGQVFLLQTSRATTRAASTAGR
jgi:hypothetical protein